jgi:lysophospholipase L1-like esterase
VKPQDAIPSKPALTGRRTAGALSPLALASFGLALGLGLAEVSARVLGLGPHVDVVFQENYRASPDPVLRYELVPGAPDDDARISSAGLRDREFAQPKPAGVFRIAVVGDSIAYGFGLPRSDALPKQLEQLLLDYHSQGVSRFEVLNFAVSGYDLEQVVETVGTRVPPFQPDLILYAYCLNDPQTDSIEYERLRARQTYDAHSPLASLERASRHLLAHSRLFLWLRSASEQRDVKPVDPQWVAVAHGTYVDYFERLYWGAGDERLTHGLAALAGVTRELHVPVAALVFPLFLKLDHYRLASVHARVLSRFEDAGIRAYDLAPVFIDMFQRHGAVFVLNALHPNALGQRLAALFAMQALAYDRLLPPPLQPWAATGELRQLDQLLEPIVARARATKR